MYLWIHNIKEKSSLRLYFATTAMKNKVKEGIKRLSKIFNL